jgi:small subunit ribosomal protein S20
MPHSKQAKKRLRQSVVRRSRNQSVKSMMRTQIKKVRQAIEDGDLEKAREELPLAMKRLDKAAKKNIVHKNTASRKISRLSARLSKLEKDSAKPAE